MRDLMLAFLGLVMGMIIGILITMSGNDPIVTDLQEHIAVPEWQTVEAWGVGYKQGFEDSRDLCIRALCKQQEMMREPMEQPLPRWNEAVGSGADRDGTPLPRPGCTAVPPHQD